MGVSYTQLAIHKEVKGSASRAGSTLSSGRHHSTSMHQHVPKYGFKMFPVRSDASIRSSRQTDSHSLDIQRSAVHSSLQEHGRQALCTQTWSKTESFSLKHRSHPTSGSYEPVCFLFGYTRKLGFSPELSSYSYSIWPVSLLADEMIWGQTS